MGNEQDKQRTDEVVQERKLTVDMYVVKDRECEDHLRAAVKIINSQPQMSLSLLPTSEEWCNTNRYLHVVKPRQVIAKLKTNQISSEFQLLSVLSYTLCRQLSAREISCWFKLNNRQLRRYDDQRSSPHLLVDDIVFGTLGNVISFFTASAEEEEEDRNTATSYEFQFDERKTRITQNAGEQLFYLEIEYKHMYPIIHVVSRRKDRFDVYFQLRQPPIMYERLNVEDASEWNWRSRRRSYIYGVLSEEIGRCDVLQVCFNASVRDTDLQDFFSKLVAFSTRWEFRFSWIQGWTTNVAAVDETEPDSSAVLYASKVLQSAGLRCQIINFLELLEGLPTSLHADFLYDVAELYENESQYYLIDVNSITERWKRRPKTNRQQSKDSMELRTVFLTPTRVVFRRPSAANESNRVFRKYFTGDRAEYVMKVYFRDEDFVQNGAKNLHFIHLLYWNHALDDQVIEATITDRLQSGIKVGRRNYRVLGGSSSLINDHGYYVCVCGGYNPLLPEANHVTAESIREQIGHDGTRVEGGSCVAVPEER